MAKSKDKKIIYRAVRFQIFPTDKQEELFLCISENLRIVWNDACEERMRMYQTWKQAKQVGEEKGVKIPTLFDQINQLTNKRENIEFAFAPRNWQEETLDRLNGSFQSFFTLAKNGDPDARPPRTREEGQFQVIPGRSGFGIKGSEITFAPNLFGKEMLKFPVPPYCLEQVARGLVKKFTISRSVSDISQIGTYWISVVYEMPMPEMIVPVRGGHVYLSLGASSIGVLAKGYNFVFDLWRPDKHWKPRIESVEKRLKSPELKKGSKRWRRRTEARKKMFAIMQRQQRQDHREIVAEFLALGRHFVVTDYVVRSKKGKLADGDDVTRGGSKGLNWAAQNTGSFRDLLAHLEEKVKEFGGSVTRHKVTTPPRGCGTGRESKIPMAVRLQEEFEDMK